MVCPSRSILATPCALRRSDARRFRDRTHDLVETRAECARLAQEVASKSCQFGRETVRLVGRSGNDTEILDRDEWV